MDATHDDAPALFFIDLHITVVSLETVAEPVALLDALAAQPALMRAKSGEPRARRETPPTVRCERISNEDAAELLRARAAGGGL